MTDDQKRRQRIELTIDMEKAQENASALRQAVTTEADNLSTVSEWLHQLGRSINVSDHDSDFYSKIMTRRVDILEESRFKDSMNFDRLIGLREQFISAQKRYEELASRLRELKATA